MSDREKNHRKTQFISSDMSEKQSCYKLPLSQNVLSGGKKSPPKNHIPKKSPLLLLCWASSQCRLPCCPQLCQLSQLRGQLWGTQPSVPSTGKRSWVPFCAVGCCDSHRSAGKSFSIWMSISICVPESKHQCLPSCLLTAFLTGLWHLQERNPIFPCSRSIPDAQTL